MIILQQLNESKNPLERSYGGIPTGGGYESNTEYEIGALRMAEALHCILGSLGKVDRTGMQYLNIEKGHIFEELEIVLKVSKEYSKELYITRLFSNDEYGQKSINNIKKVSPILNKIARKEKLNCDFINNTILEDVAKSCYGCLVQLSNIMNRSVEKLIDNKPSFNALNDVLLKDEINYLEREIKELYN